MIVDLRNVMLYNLSHKEDLILNKALKIIIREEYALKKSGRPTIGFKEVSECF